MAYIELLDLPGTRITPMDSIIKNSASFLISNPQVVVPSVDRDGIVSSSLDTIRTVSSSMVGRILDTCMDLFTFVDLSREKELPPALLIPWMQFDTLIFKDRFSSAYAGLSTLEKFNDKMILAVDAFMKSARMTDTTDFHSMLVRSALHRSYVRADRAWLTPTIITNAATIYAMVISTRIAKMYTLTYNEHMKVAAYFAVYFKFICSADKVPEVNVLKRIRQIQQAIDIVQIEDDVQKKSVDGFGIKEVIELVVENGPSRMKDYTPKAFYSSMTNYSSNNMLSVIGTEYPPYWISFILDTMSGSKTGMFFAIKMSNMKKDAIVLSKDLLNSKSFIPDIY